MMENLLWIFGASTTMVGESMHKSHPHVATTNMARKNYPVFLKPDFDSSFTFLLCLSRFVLSKLLQPTVKENEIMTDIGYPIVPSGLYESIVKSSELGVPLYITETGASDAIGDRQKVMIKGYTNEVRNPCRGSWSCF